MQQLTKAPNISPAVFERIYDENIDSPLEGESTSISSGDRSKKISNQRGGSGTSPHPSSQKQRKRVEQSEFEIVETSPLEGLDNVVKEQLDRMGLEISPERIYHAIRIKYLFGRPEDEEVEGRSEGQIARENYLYTKVVEGLKSLEGVPPEGRWFNKFGWVWPDLYLDDDQNLPAHFTIQMHRNGRFIIPLKRDGADINIKEFLYEFCLILSKILDTGELGEFISKLCLVKRTGDNEFKYMRDDDGNYIHLAHEIDPDKRVEELGLNKAKATIHFIDYERNPDVDVYIDKSTGEFEIEGEFDTPEGEDLFDAVTRGAIVAGNLSKIRGKVGNLNRDHTRIKATTTSNNKMLQTQTNQLTTVLKQQDQIQDKQQSYFNALDAQLTQQHDVIETIPEFQKANIEINNTIAQTIMGISQMTMNQGQIFDQALGQAKEEIIGTQKEDTDLLMNEVQHQNQKLDTIQEKIIQMSDRIDVLRDVFETQFEKARRQYKDNLLRVLDLVAKMPGRTSKELIGALKEELDVSQTTMYKYFRKLQEKDLIDVQKYNDGTRGRPSRIFSITDKLKNLIKKITKN